MNNDLVKAAMILGISCGASILLASGIIVIGVRWAVADALGPRVAALDASIASAAGDVNNGMNGLGERVDRAAGAIGGDVSDASTSLAKSFDTSLGSGVANLNESIAGTGATIGGRLDAASADVSGTLARSFRDTLKIEAPQPLPLTGTLGVVGPGEEPGPVEVNASVSGLP